MAADEHPRVRTEAVRALSFYPTPDAIDAVLGAAKKPSTTGRGTPLEAALGANEAVWRQAYLTGKLAKDNPAGRRSSTTVLAASKAGGGGGPVPADCCSARSRSRPRSKNKAMTALAMLKGNPTNGREVFVRNCTACHKVGNGEGQEYGPNMAEVGNAAKTRLQDRRVDHRPERRRGQEVPLDADRHGGRQDRHRPGGERDKNEVVIFDGKEKKTIKVDDIDGAADAQAEQHAGGPGGDDRPAEFLDLIEYLAAQKQ